LTKRYAGQTAIQDLNFEVSRGEIMGFLGPNGAGKTTTMRILAGFMPPTSGRASIAGFDVFEKSLQARAHLGTLSKGYRQRVGLADALVAEPDLLILDEPTIGLDPNQIRQVRELIKNLGRQHTILLSTHILPEVEMTCSRVIIIHKGRIEACDTPENLLGKIRQAGGVELEAKVGNDNGEEQLKKIAGVRDVVTDSEDDWKKFSLRVESGSDVREEVFRLAVERRWAVRELTQRRGTLEDVFVELTHPDQI
jgi:ABC-2 type transport system ATP-binding protein